MSSQVRRAARLGGLGQAALLPPAAFAVHQLRYMLAYGAAAGPELQRTGHSYLHSAAPWLILLVALAVGGFLRTLGRAFARQTTLSRYSVSFVALWISCTGALVAIFAVQELLEGAFAAGHPVGLTGIFAFGGLWAIPAAACLGLVLAAVFHGAHWLVGEVARRAARRSASTPFPEPVPAPASGPFALTRDPLLAGWSTRGPPLRALWGSSR